RAFLLIRWRNEVPMGFPNTLSIMKKYLCLSRLLIVGLAILSSALATRTCHAATRSWDGGGSSGFWDVSGNWTSNTAPANGDALVFPDNASRLLNTNRASG